MPNLVTIWSSEGATATSTTVGSVTAYQAYCRSFGAIRRDHRPFHQRIITKRPRRNPAGSLRIAQQTLMSPLLHLHHGRRVAPQPIQAVVVAFVRREDVHDDGVIVQQNPPGLGLAFLVQSLPPSRASVSWILPGMARTWRSLPPLQMTK